MPRIVRPANLQRDTTDAEVVPVTGSVVPTIVNADPETEVQLTRSEFESQLLAIVVAWCDSLHLVTPSTVEEVVNRVHRWADERLSKVAIASISRQLESARA